MAYGGPMDFGMGQQERQATPLMLKDELARRRGSSPRALSLGQLISLIGGGPGSGGGGAPTIPPVLNTLFNPSGNSGHPLGGGGLPFSNF